MCLWVGLVAVGLLYSGLVLMLCDLPTGVVIVYGELWREPRFGFCGFCDLDCGKCCVLEFGC